MEQNSEQWHEWRKLGLGGSDIAGVIGVCKYSSPHMIWSDKAIGAIRFEGNHATNMGRELEDKARKRYELFYLEDMPPALAIHPKYDICRVSLDGFNGKTILEIKCVGLETHNIARSGKVPDHYWPQVQWQLCATGADELHYFSYYDKEQSHALVCVKPDVEYQGMLLAKALDFWERYVSSKTPPPLTDMDIKLVSTPEIQALMLQLKDKDKMKKSDFDAAKKRVIELGGHSRIRCGNVLVTKINDVYRMTTAKQEGIGK